MRGSCKLVTPLSLSLSLSTPFPLSSIIKPLHYSHFFTASSSSCSSISTSPISHKPQIPLFLRPPIYSSTLQDLQKFLNWAKKLTCSVGSTFVQLDNGPDSTLLLRELNWFLQDVLEDSSIIPHLGLSQKTVGLKVSLDEMYNLWKQRIEERRPFQYIVGCEHWRDLVLSVEQGILIPRPETEKIVDLVGEVVCQDQGLKRGVWADLGTGSGALAIAISRLLGETARVIATDLSPVSVAVARYNVERYGLQDVIEVKQGSWFEPLVGFEGQLVGVVSNPPYIPSENINNLQAEVGKYEPMLALDGGVEGMDSLFHLCSTMSTMLKPGAFFAFETNGEYQCNILAEYLRNETGNSFYDVKIIPDFCGILRFVTGYRV